MIRAAQEAASTDSEVPAEIMFGEKKKNARVLVNEYV